MLVCTTWCRRPYNRHLCLFPSQESAIQINNLIAALSQFLGSHSTSAAATTIYGNGELTVELRLCHSHKAFLTEIDIDCAINISLDNLLCGAHVHDLHVFLLNKSGKIGGIFAVIQFFSQE